MLTRSTIQRYTDVYFLRALEVLQKLSMNPFVRAQVFIRNGPGAVAGIEEVVAVLKTCSDLFQNGGKVYGLGEHEKYSPNETVLLIEGRIQDFITLETVILGILSSRNTQLKFGRSIDPEEITNAFWHIVSLVGSRPVYYFGARHWHYTSDAACSAAAFAGGAVGASTLAGAEAGGQAPVGTIPHSLENIFAWKYGADTAVLESAVAFDETIDPAVPRVALVDYNNREIDDSLAVAMRVRGLSGVRVDTCGENVMQSADRLIDPNRPFWSGGGVTISGVSAVRKSLDDAGYGDVKIALSSGFGNLEKVRAFVEAEEFMQIQLFDSLGVGNVYDAIIATMDIVGVGESIETLVPVAKVGRAYRPNPRLRML